MGKRGPQIKPKVVEAIIAASADKQNIGLTTASTIQRVMNAKYSNEYGGPEHTPSLPTIIKIAGELEQNGLLCSQSMSYGNTRQLITYTPTNAGKKHLENQTLSQVISEKIAHWDGSKTTSRKKKLS